MTWVPGCRLVAVNTAKPLGSSGPVAPVDRGGEVLGGRGRVAAGERGDRTGERRARAGRDDPRGGRVLRAGEGRALRAVDDRDLLVVGVGAVDQLRLRLGEDPVV